MWTLSSFVAGKMWREFIEAVGHLIKIAETAIGESRQLGNIIVLNGRQFVRLVSEHS
jgi:hypothetical protein